MTENHPPYVKVPGDFSRVGTWCDGVNRCSRGDCPHFRNHRSPGPPRRGDHRRCAHPDGLDAHIGDELTLCVPWYRALQRLCASLLDAAKVPRP